MNQSEIDRIKDYCAKATNGPWRFALAYKKEHYGPLVAAVAPGHHIQAENCSGGTYPNRDAEFIAQARTDLPAAIAEIERLKAELEAIRDTADSVVAARAKVELPPDSPLNAAVFCLAKAFRDIGRGLET